MQSYRKVYQKYTAMTKHFSSRYLYALLVLCLWSILFFSCCPSVSQNYGFQEHKQIDSLVKAITTTDSLQLQLNHYIADENKIGVIIAHNELGVRYREMARFNEAIECHRKGLELALQLKDTLEIVQALNNIGTNYRRLGILDEASTFHYKALLLCERYTDKTSYTARKNRVISLSGIGNIHLTLDNRVIADSIFRVALAGEQALGSDLGQAMNYSNLGAIFERRGMPDSALVYFQQSMKHNSAINSVVGISLCHNNFGRLYEKAGRWNDALREYRSAYDLMVENSDLYHWLEACLALARVNISKGDVDEAKKYLERAEKAALETHSWEHMSKVYQLDYLWYRRKGDYHRALDCYILSRSYADSVKNADSQTHVQNLRVNYERDKSNRELSLIRENYRIEQRTKNIFLMGSLFVLLVTIIALGFLWYALRMKSRNQRIMRRMEIVRNNFFTNVTHEFRTPLTVILGLSEQLQKDDGTADERQNSLATIVRQGQSLLNMVNQLLEVSKVKSEIGNPDWRHGDIIAYTRMIIEDYRAYARQKQIDLRFIPSDTVVAMDFVPEYFCKIVRNLLSNSFKFTPKGGVIILTTKRSGNTFVIHIADSGVGIMPEDLPHIFDTFYQGENSIADIGTGIGLAFVRQMVNSMEGHISVNSTPGKGSLFTITLPLKHGDTVWEKWIPGKQTQADINYSTATDDRLQSSVESTISLNDGIRPTILIVEDNADVSYYIGGLLKENYRILYACDGDEGWEKANEYIPDLIVTDLMMPEKDGYELCREIRQSEVLNHIPIIVITAKCNEEDRIKLLDIGADAYLYKPFNADELHIRIARLLEQRRRLREKYSIALHEGTEQSVELSAIDKNFLVRLNDVVYAMMSNTNLSSDMVADCMCMSLSQLNRKMKTITGFSSSGYILQMRMDKAKRMLSSTETPIGDIALECGFPEISYFSRIFKQTFQITPSQYRKGHQK